MYYIICLVLVSVARVCGQTDLLVESSAGHIYGVKGEEFVQFLGIPYGVVDDSDPFGPATPPSRFSITSPYNAFNVPVICPQIVKGIPQGSIHCLHLNVYAPNDVSKNSTLPVMVFIHGGGFIDGDGNLGSYSPRFLVKKNVMVVTVNYRLGPFGFLCLDEHKYNNQGLKDQDLALKWVKDNIKSFGGDENNILLFGHSAGSMAADIHLLFNENRVFNKLILQSGQALSPYLIPHSPNDDYISEVAKRLKIDVKNLKTEDILKKLSNVNALSLINVTRNDLIRPCVDGMFIKQSFEDINLKDMKIMIGSSSKEMIYFYKDVDDYIKRTNDDLSAGFIDLSVDSNSTIKEFYSINMGKDNAINFGTDFVFNYPIERSIRYYLKNHATVYRYLFSYDGGRNFVKYRDNISGAGAAHGDELGYLFDMDLFGDIITKEDEIVIDTMTTFWTNFAKYGNPTPAISNSLAGTWPNVEEEGQKYIMDIRSSAIVQEDFLQKQMLFWDFIYRSVGTVPRGISLGHDYERRSNATKLYLSFTLAIIVIILMSCKLI